MIKYLICILFISLVGCESPSVSEPKNGVVIQTSTDIQDLERLLSFDRFKPTKVKYLLIVAHDSILNDHEIVAIPKAGLLQALLYFDSSTFHGLKQRYEKMDYHHTQLRKEKFNFFWLDEDVKSELQNSDDETSETDFFFGT